MATRSIKTFDEFKAELNTDTELQEEFKANPVAAINTFQQKNPLETDRWIYRIVVLALGSTILAIIIGVIALMGTGHIEVDGDVPTILTAIGSAAIGALAGLLAPSPKGT